MRDLVMAVHWLRRALKDAQKPDVGGPSALLCFGYAWQCHTRALRYIDIGDEHRRMRWQGVHRILDQASWTLALRLRSVDRG